ncbi:MAG TPA: helix-turn-helix domain-containing protein [Selenomonadales bacterium]|nr:helix-turn-helix domain-containing protein [Selenomonadales bacterium]
MNRRENITIAALRLFWLRGYNYVSLIDVARELGMTKGGIYHYFSSKEALLREAVHYFLDRVEQKYGELFSGAVPLRETVRSMIADQELERYIQELLGIDPAMREGRHVHFALEIMQHFPDIQARLEQSHANCCRIVEERVAAAMEKGEIRRDLVGTAIGTILFSVLSGQQLLASRFDNPDKRQETADSLVRMIAS